MAHQNGSEWTDTATDNLDGSGSTDPGSDNSDISIGEALQALNTTSITWEDVKFLDQIQNRYTTNQLFSIIMENPKDYQGFKVKGSIVWYTSSNSDKVICIPCNQDTIVKILDQAYETVGHFGNQ